MIDDLDRVRAFRADVVAPTEAAERAAREALTRAIARARAPHVSRVPRA